MRFLKRTVLLFATFILILSCRTRAFAAEEFVTDFETTYTVNLAGQTTVEQQITLTNKLSNVYATQYALEIGSTRIKSVAVYGLDGKAIPFSVKETGTKTAIVLSFNDKVVGKGKKHTFTVKYTNLDASQKLGNVLEVNVPRVSDEGDIDSFDVIIRVPIQFGEPKIVSPTSFSEQVTKTHTIISFTTEEAKKTGISAIFGDSQVFEFSLNYNLENPTVSSGITQVVLPPDTSYQRVYFDSITPEPQKVEYDDDGNWIATFDLEPKQRTTVKVLGKAMVYLEPTVPIPPLHTEIKTYLLPQKFWPVSDPNVLAVAKELDTPKKIYDYLVNTFTYNYERVSAGSERLGAKTALDSPENSICTEFTDAFVTIARANGIPARELNGYGYTENSKLRPLSLVQDVLHAWPEYYDSESESWIPIDPTWGNTTGGIDFFNHLDFNHFVLAIHGSSSEKPYPAGYYKFEGEDSKDINISFSPDEPELITDFEVTFLEPRSDWFSKRMIQPVEIKNRSNAAVYDIEPEIITQGLRLIQNDKVVLEAVPPYGSQIVELYLEPVLSEGEGVLKLILSEKSYESKVDVGKIGGSQLVTLAGGIALGSVFAFVAYRAGGLLVSWTADGSTIRRQGQEPSK